MPIDQDILRIASSISSANPAAVDEDLMGSVDEALRHSESRKEKMKSFAKKRMDEAWFPRTTAIAERIGTKAASLVARPFSEETSDRLQNLGDAFRDEQSRRYPGMLERASAGVAETLPTMVLSAAAGGVPAVIGIAAAESADSAYTQAKDAGLSKGRAAIHAGTMGAIEGGISGVFQLAGLGGAEKMLAKGLKGAANTGFKQGMKDVGLAGLHELPEELSIGLSSNLASMLQGVDPDAMSPDRTRATVHDTILQTGLTVAAVGSPHVVRSTKVGKLQRTSDEITAAAASGEIVTRKQWRSWGFSTLGGSSAPERMAVVKDIAANIAKAKAEQTAGQQEADADQAPAQPQIQDLAQAPVQRVEAHQQQVVQPEVAAEAVQPPQQPAVATETSTEPQAQPEEAVEPPATPESAPEAPAGEVPELTGIKNAIVDDIRAGRGDTPISEVEPETQEQWVNTAHDKISSEPTLPDDLVDELNYEPRNISDVETAVLQIQYRRLNNAFAASYEEANRAREAGDKPAESAAQAKSERLLKKLNEIENAAKAAGREWGRAGVARQMVLKADYSLGSVIRRMRTANGGKPLSAEDEARAAELSDEANRLLNETAEAEAEKFNQDSDEGVDREIAEASSQMLDGKPASQWMRQGLVVRAKGLGILPGVKKRSVLIKEINSVENDIREAAEENGVSFPVLLEAIRVNYHDMTEIAEHRRKAQAIAHKTAKLSKSDVERLENNGLDYSNVKGYDDALASLLETPETSVYLRDSSNPNDALWDFLKEPAVPAAIRYNSPDLINLALAWIESKGQGLTDADVPVRRQSSEVQAHFFGETQAKQSPRSSRAVAKEEVNTAWAELKAILSSSPKEKGGLLGGESGALNVDLLASSAKLVKAYANLGIATFTEVWAKAKVQLGDVAEMAGDSLRKAWDDAVKAGIVRRPEIASDDTAAIRKLARKITRSAVQSGISDREAVVDKVLEELRQIIPDITRRQAMDAISGYGVYSELSKEAVDAQIRAITGELQQLAKLDDISKNRPPKKTGTERRTPGDTERQLIQKVNESMKRAKFGAYDKGRHLKSSLEAAKTASRNRIKDLETEINNKEKIVKERTAIVPDDELKALREKLAKLREEHAKVFQKQPLTREQHIVAVNKMIDQSIFDLESDIDSGNIGPKDAPAKISTPEIDAKRARLKELRDVRQEMRDAMDPNPFDQKRTDAYRKSLEKRLEDLNRRVKEGDFSKREVKHVKPDVESINLKYKISDVKNKLDEMEKAIKRKQLKGLAKLYDHLGEAMNASRAIMTSMDFSAVLRQGAMTTYSHPLLTAKALPDMFRAFYSKEGEFAAAENLRRRPNARLYAIAKLAIQTTESSLSKQEEAFFGTWQRHIPGVAGSARAYVTFLNRMRADTFDSMIATLSANMEPTVEEAKHVANYVNVATGRGSVGRHGAGADILATYFFAPRYMASRFQLLLGLPLRGGTMRTKGLVVKEYVRSTAGLATFFGVAALGGLFSDDPEDKPIFEFDPRSPEFGKIRFGQLIVDPLAGLSQTATLIARVVGGKTKKSTGEIVSIRGESRPFNGLTTSGAIAKFLQGKLAPAPGMALNLLSGENVVGEKVVPFGGIITSPVQSAKDILSGKPVQLGVFEEAMIPLSFGDIYDAMQANGITKKAALPVLVVFGVGVKKFESATPGEFASKIAGHPKLKGKSKTGKEFDYIDEVAQVVLQAKKRGVTKHDMQVELSEKMKKGGSGADAIRRAKLRLGNRYK